MKADKQDQSPGRTAFLTREESASFGVVGAVVGIASGYASFLSQKIHGAFALFAVCTVLTLVTVGTMILVKRVPRVPTSGALAFAVVAALVGGGAVYLADGAGRDESPDPAVAAGSPAPPALPSESATPSAPAIVPSTVQSAEPSPAVSRSKANPTRPPTAAPSRPAPSIRNSFTEPDANAAPIDPGTDVKLAGEVDGLSAENELWVLSVTADPGSAYYIAKAGPVTVKDGKWETIAYGLGDSSDIGKSRTFFGVDADEDCASALREGSEVTPRKVASLPPTCRRLSPSVVVRFRS